MKQYLVIGLGNFGATVVRELSRLGCRVTAVDRDRDKVQLMKDVASVVAIVGNAANHEFVARLQVPNFDGVLVSTGEDSHASILITMYLKELSAQAIIVKANSVDHAKILTKVGATQTVIPEQQMAAKVAHSLAQPNMIDFLPLASNFVVAELKPAAHLVGRRLKDSHIRAEYQVQVIAVRKAPSDRLIFVPDGDYVIQASDVLFVLGLESDIVRMRG